MLRAKKVGLLVKIALLILLAYLIITLVNVRQQIGDAHAAIETLTEQVNDQTQANTELSTPSKTGTTLLPGGRCPGTAGVGGAQ